MSYKKLEIIINSRNLFNINSYNTLKIELLNKTTFKLKFFIKLDFNVSIDRDYSNKLFILNSKEKREDFLKIFCKRRGELKSEYIFLKGISILRLFNVYRKEKKEISIKILPHIPNINESIRLLQTKIFLETGVNKTQNIGDGNDFEMLREYNKNDQYNKIDWKATARFKKPITRVYKMNNFLDIVLLIDCGRIMSTEVKGLSLLDYAINSTLLLSYASIKNNDSLSIICFSNEIKKYISKLKNKKDIYNLRNILSEVNYDFFEPDYKQTFIFLNKNIKKRSLIILFTDIIDDSNINIFKESFSLLVKRHLVLLVLLRDKNLFNIAESIPITEKDIFKKSAACDMILKRDRTIYSLKKLGIGILDIFPEDLNPSLINKYIEIKSKY